jgi:hypothetical protein
MITIETPDFSKSSDQSANKSSPITPTAAGRRGSSILLHRPDENIKNNSLCALKVHAEMNLIDIVEDSLAVEQTLKSLE